jgi:hypothetical protein
VGACQQAAETEVDGMPMVRRAVEGRDSVPTPRPIVVRHRPMKQGKVQATPAGFCKGEKKKKKNIRS